MSHQWQSLCCAVVSKDGRQDLHVVEATGGDHPQHSSFLLPCSRNICYFLQGSRHSRGGRDGVLVRTSGEGKDLLARLFSCSLCGFKGLTGRLCVQGHHGWFSWREYGLLSHVCLSLSRLFSVDLHTWREILAGELARCIDVC